MCIGSKTSPAKQILRTGILAGEKRAGSQPSAGQVATLSGIVRDLIEKSTSTYGNGKEDRCSEDDDSHEDFRFAIVFKFPITMT